MGKVTPELLASCLDDQRSRESLPVEDPVTAAELRALLDVASSIAPPPPVEPDPAFRSRGRATLIAAIAAEQDRGGRSALRGLWQALDLRWAPQPALTAIVALALTLATGGGIVSAAQDTLPGDALYPVKTTVESAQLALVASDEARVQAYLDLAERRLAEVEQASQRGRSDAARDAAEAFAQQVAKADQHLDQASSKGKDVSRLEAKVAEKLARHQAVLARVQNRAPDAARPALARAAEAAQKGLTNASAHAGGTAASQESESTPTHQNANKPPKNEPKRQPNVTQDDLQLSVEDQSADAALAEIVADVEALATESDTGTPGPHVDGLLAKLRAARAALERGQDEVAVHNLDAFQQELNALLQSGRLEQDQYDALHDRYVELVTSLGGAPKEKPTTTDERSKPDRTPGPRPNPRNGGNPPGLQSAPSKGRPQP